MRHIVLILGLGGALAGCARSYEPIVDTKGIDQAQYEADLADCRQYAEKVNVGGEAGMGAVVGTVLGAALGAVAGSFGANVGSGAALGAGVGAIGGGASGAAGGVHDQKQVINNCLRGRGYSILR